MLTVQSELLHGAAIWVGVLHKATHRKRSFRMQRIDAFRVCSNIAPYPAVVVILREIPIEPVTKVTAAIYARAEERDKQVFRVEGRSCTLNLWL